MTSVSELQFIRDYSLLVLDSNMEGLDLSDMHFRFRITQSNEESPNTATIRIYNLSKETVNAIIIGKANGLEYTQVRLSAGYKNATVGQIFSGTIKQFHKGKESATDPYLDILAADGDPEYNFGVVNDSLPAGTTTGQALSRITGQMGFTLGYTPDQPTGGILPRGKVLWGMGRAALRNIANSQGWGWTVINGSVQMIPLSGYLPDEIVVLNRDTGLIGIPEQTDEGIKARCLLNSKLKIGGVVRIDNSTINQTIAQSSNAIPFGQLPYDQWAGLQTLADVTNDGDYFIYVAEHSGDTRGVEWYTDLVCLAVDKSKQQVEPYG